MAEKRYELVIRIGKTVGPDKPNGYKPEEPIDPKLSIELAHYLVGGSLEFDIAVGDWYASGRVVEVPPDETVKPDVHPGIECLGSKIPVGSEDEQKCLDCIRNFQHEHSFKDYSINPPCCLIEDALEIQKRKALACPVWKKYQVKLPPNFHVIQDSKLKYKQVKVKSLEYGELYIPADCIHVVPKLSIRTDKVEKYRLCYLPSPGKIGGFDGFMFDVSIEEGKRLSKIETDFIYHPERYKLS